MDLFRWNLGWKFCWINGIFHENKENTKKTIDNYIWITYRYGMNTDIKTDAGWGCMYRSAQMLLSRIIQNKFDLSNEDIIYLFDDNQEAPFNLDKMLEISKKLDVYPGTHVGPHFISFVIKDLIKSNSLLSDLNFYIAENTTIVKEKIFSYEYPLIISIPVLFGKYKVEENYYTTILSMLQHPTSIGALGGIGKKANYIIGFVDNNRLLCLDPHFCQNIKNPRYKCNYPSTFLIKKMNPSVSFYYYCKNINQVESLIDYLDLLPFSPINIIENEYNIDNVFCF